ncbi:MAG TPA: helix-turn-helix domain-containing protein [Rhizomicrobium sp.]|nr:helix-turn-helix domain-containing protein [Rhizomicrobium sp.]
MESVHERRAKQHTATRSAILGAARTVAAREGAREFSLRGVAAEAGFSPAALYGYFRDKDELLVALAADDLSALSREMRLKAGEGLQAVAARALDHLRHAETIAAASCALSAGESESARLFNGRLIAVLRALSEAAGNPADSRESQADVLLIAAAVTGLAALERTGRLDALGFDAQEVLARLGARLSGSFLAPP